MLVLCICSVYYPFYVHMSIPENTFPEQRWLYCGSYNKGCVRAKKCLLLACQVIASLQASTTDQGAVRDFGSPPAQVDMAGNEHIIYAGLGRYGRWIWENPVGMISSLRSCASSDFFLLCYHVS